jgi:hypothetical protein
VVDGQQLSLEATHRQQQIKQNGTFDTDWLLSLPEPGVPGVYVPQLGDEVVYLPQGHREHLQEFPEARTPPWKNWPDCYPAVQATVVDLDYQFPPKVRSKELCWAIECIVTLEVTALPEIPMGLPQIIPSQSSSGESTMVALKAPEAWTGTVPGFRPRKVARVETRGSHNFWQFQICLRKSNLADYIILAQEYTAAMTLPWTEGLI